MNQEQLAIFDRIQAFQLDVPEASYPFSKKLAHENHWSQAYARRVIEEYKRFAFLAVVAGHPVSPSEDVDEAWHLHLMYTQNYWKVFCPQVLQMPFHHNPSAGGKSERDKFDDWYLKTLDSYRRLLGTEPPSDIWPSPEERKAIAARTTKVDRGRHWVIRKPDFVANARLATVAFLSLFIFGCSGAVEGVNPFDWRGPEFLQFYIGLYPVCLGLALWTRYILRTPIHQQTMAAPHLEPYQMAYLQGGKWAVIDIAIAGLVHKKMLEVVVGTGKLLPTEIPFTGGPGLEPWVYSLANREGGIAIRDVRSQCAAQAAAVGEDLKQLGLIVSDAQATKSVAFPLLVASIVPIIGVMKIMIGISRDRPVSYLILLCIMTTLVSLVALARRPHRSRYGDNILSLLRERFAHMQSLGHHHHALDGQDVPIAVALFGTVALAGSEMAYLSQSLRTPPSGSSGCSTASSCGGGGSSCGGGGGGCGGGGCGGCGG